MAYKSEDKEYKLKKGKLFSIVGELYSYAESREVNGAISGDYGFAFVHGDGKSLEIITSASSHGIESMFTVAALSEGRKALKFRV